MEFPSNLKYTSDHEWIQVLEEDGGQFAKIGVTDFAQSELGDLVYVEVETVDETLAEGEVFGTVEAVKTTSDLYMPVSGKIIEFNNELSDEGGDNPTLINTDPYGEGWIVKIEISDPAQLDKLLDAAAYEAEVTA